MKYTLKETAIYIREKEILTNIFKEYKDKTIIVISHKSDNNNLYDRVIDLSKKEYEY